jgi:hypothetical protein
MMRYEVLQFSAAVTLCILPTVFKTATERPVGAGGRPKPGGEIGLELMAGKFGVNLRAGSGKFESRGRLVT